MSHNFLIIERGKRKSDVKRKKDNVCTCDWSLKLNHGFLCAEEGGSLVDDLERGMLVYPSLEDKVLLQDLQSKEVTAGVYGLYGICDDVVHLQHDQSYMGCRHLPISY